jgi:hypothetical protein
MTARKPFLLRMEPALFAAIEQWAADDLRSVNGQIEFLLRDALRRAGRKVKPVVEEAAAIEVEVDDDEAPPVRKPARRS